MESPIKGYFTSEFDRIYVSNPTGFGRNRIGLGQLRGPAFAPSVRMQMAAYVAKCLNEREEMLETLREVAGSLRDGDQLDKVNQVIERADAVETF